MFGLKFRRFFFCIVLVLFINHYLQSEETRSYLSTIFEELPYAKDIYSHSSDFYITHLQTFYIKWRFLINKYYAVLNAKFDEIPGSQNIKYFLKDVYSDVRPEIIQFFSYIDLLMMRIYKKYIWKGYIYSRIHLYTKIAPYIKKHIYTLTCIHIPAFYESAKLKIHDVCCIKVPFCLLSLYNKYVLSTKTFYTNIVPPTIQIYIDVIYNNSKPVILPAYEFFANLMTKSIKYTKFYYAEFLKKYCLLAFHYLSNMIKCYSKDYYEKIVGLYYDILTSDPLDEEIIRLYSLLDIYESVAATSIIATITSTSTIYSQKTNAALDFSNPLNDFAEKVINLGHNKDDLSPVAKKLNIWESLIVDTGNDVFADVDATFLEQQQKYIDDGFKSLLETNIRDLNEYISKSYTEIQTYIKNIDTADIYMTNDNLIINEYLLKTPKFKNHNKDLKFFKNVYPNPKVDPFGLTYDNYLQLIDEVDYLNDLLYNKTMIQKSSDDINFPDRDFFLEHVLQGKDIDVSFGKVSYPDTVEVNEFQLLTPGQYLVTSELLKRVTISNANRNIINKVDRKLVRDAFKRVRATIEDKANVIHQIIENGFFEILEEYNKIKFRNLDVFEDFCDIILEEWDKKFLEFLEAEEQKSDQYLFDDPYNHIKESANHLLLEGEEREYIGDSEIIEAFNSEKLEDRKKIRSAHCWKTYKKFYEIKDLLLKLRDNLNSLPPNLKEMQQVAESVGKTVYFLLSESNQYLDLLRAQANLEFQFREEFDYKERVRRYNKVNEDNLEKLEEKKLREEMLKVEHDKFMSRLLDGVTDDEDVIQEKLGHFKKGNEIIEELENNDNIEYYYDTETVEISEYSDSSLDDENTMKKSRTSRTESIPLLEISYTASTISTNELLASSESYDKTSAKSVDSILKGITSELRSAVLNNSSYNTKSSSKPFSAEKTQITSSNSSNILNESSMMEGEQNPNAIESKVSIEVTSKLSKKISNAAKTVSLEDTLLNLVKQTSLLLV